MEVLLFSKETDEVMTIVEVTGRERIKVSFHLETHKMKIFRSTICFSAKLMKICVSASVSVLT